LEARNPCRWAHLGLANGDPTARLPEQGSTADLLIWAMVPPSATEPVEGMVDGVRVELAALAQGMAPGRSPNTSVSSEGASTSPC
jgi:hypothetical protein